MSSTLQSRRSAGLALTGIIVVGLASLGIKLALDETLRERLGPTYTFACFLLLFIALGGLAVKMGIQISRLREVTRIHRENEAPHHAP